jgi:hypothetical protein
MIMEVLGHDQFATTMNIYGHIMPSLKRAAARRMDAFLQA